MDNSPKRITWTRICRREDCNRPTDANTTPYCPWCEKKLDDARGIVAEYRASRMR